LHENNPAPGNNAAADWRRMFRVRCRCHIACSRIREGVNWIQQDGRRRNAGCHQGSTDEKGVRLPGRL
jgi:hypothetical protein